jgi:hypothetical protein
MKKLLFTFILIITLVAVLSLTACSGGTASSPAAPATSAKPPAATTAAPAPATSAAPAPASSAAPAPASSAAPPPASSAAAAKPVTVNLGGTFAVTGAYAEDVAACLNGYQDYAKWVNENHIIAPWYPDKKIPANWNINVMWADDQLAPDKALTIYDQQKSAGILVERVSGSPEGLALINKFADDNMGATSQAAGPWVLAKSQNIFPNYPVYTDSLAAVADWFKANWKGTAKPRVAYLTANNPMGKGIETPEMKNYLTSAGFDWVGAQYVELVPTAPPTTQLAWLKDNKVDLAIGVMTNAGSQPTIKEAVRLGMGTDQAYKITFAFATPNHLQQFLPAMGATGNGVIVGGGYAPWDDTVDGIKFARALLDKYDGGKTPAPLYMGGLIESMTQLEAIRLASTSLNKPYEQLKPADVLKNGFYQIKDFSVGSLTPNLTYGPSYAQGVGNVAVYQIQNAKIVKLGNYPLHDLYAK